VSSEVEADGRIEPRLDGGVPIESITFLQKGKPRPAGRALRAATFALAGLHVAVQLANAVANGRGAPAILGTGVGALLVVMLPMWLYGLWDGDLQQRRKYQIVAGTATVLLAAQLVGFFSERGLFQELAPQQLRERALQCQGRGDFACADSLWTRYLALRPDDDRARATLGMVKNQRGDDAGAIREFERALAKGNGGYDLFAYHARSLARVGRTAEAITWYYAALSAVPTLVDVRRELSRLLVGQGRHYEALAVLQALDAQREANGQAPYFTADRIAIQEAIRTGGSEAAPQAALRLAALGGHFYAPVSLGGSRHAPFMVDTGATLVSVSNKALNDSGVRYRVLDPDARMKTADGRSVPARLLLLERLQVGPYLLRDVKAVSCDNCAALLGVSAISRFDLKSAKEHGTEFLSLVPRN